MVLWTKLWYYTENYGTSIYEGENMVDYKNKEKKCIHSGKNYRKIPK